MIPATYPPEALAILDLDAYFSRIGYGGPRDATRHTLDALSLAHVSSIPFENLDVLLERGIDLELGAIQRKLVFAGRGGYCFEQNSLFLAVLQKLGFEVQPLSARVRIGRPRDFIPPRTHVFVRVELEGDSWIADVGVGGLSLTSAIRLFADGEQPTAHEPRRIVLEEGRYFHQARLGEDWVDVCEFSGEPMYEIDRELGNWFTSAHPKSHFRNRLVVARAAPGGRRISMLNNELTLRGADGRAEVQKLTSPAALLAALNEHFGLHFPAGTEFRLYPFGEVVAG